MNKIIGSLFALLLLVGTGCSTRQIASNSVDENKQIPKEYIETAVFAGDCFWCREAEFEKYTEQGVLESEMQTLLAEESKKQLTDLQYHITQENGKERPFDNEYWDNTEPGIYVDLITGEPLFSSVHKYKSGTGWPSFTEPISNTAIHTNIDFKLIYPRTEVRSRRGNNHLGHVFKDGPKDQGGLRYCMNSAAMRFIPVEHMEKKGYGEYLSLFDNQ